MAWQLIYTSAPRLLEAGRSGFGTVARHQQISPLLVSACERASQFARLPGLDVTRLVLSHRIVTTGGARYHVLSCIRDAGSDHTRRTNHLAHHLIAEEREIAQLRAPAPSPADVLLAMRWVKAWNKAPCWFDVSEEIDLVRFAQSSGNGAWARVTGKAMHARLLCDTKNGRGVSLIAPPGTNVCALFSESLRLVPERAWRVTFTTSLQPSDDAADFDWLAVEPTSPLRAQLESSGRLILDLADPATLVAVEPVSPPSRAIAPAARATSHVVDTPAPATTRAGDPFGDYQPTRARSPKTFAIMGGAAALILIGAVLLLPWYRARQEEARQRAGIVNALAATSLFDTAKTRAEFAAELGRVRPADLPRARAFAEDAANLAVMLNKPDFDALRRAPVRARLQAKAEAIGLNLPFEVGAIAMQLDHAAELEGWLQRFPAAKAVDSEYDELRGRCAQLGEIDTGISPEMIRAFGKVRESLQTLSARRQREALRALLDGEMRPARDVAWFRAEEQVLSERDGNSAEGKRISTLLDDWSAVQSGTADDVQKRSALRGKEWPKWLLVEARKKEPNASIAGRGDGAKVMPASVPTATSSDAPIYVVRGIPGLNDFRIPELSAGLSYFFRTSFDSDPIELINPGGRGNLRRRDRVSGDPAFRVNEMERTITPEPGSSEFTLPFILLARSVAGAEVVRLWIVPLTEEALLPQHRTGLTRDGDKLRIDAASLGLPGPFKNPLRLRLPSSWNIPNTRSESVEVREWVADVSTLRNTVNDAERKLRAEIETLQKPLAPKDAGPNAAFHAQAAKVLDAAGLQRGKPLKDRESALRLRERTAPLFQQCGSYIVAVCGPAIFPRVDALAKAGNDLVQLDPAASAGAQAEAIEKALLAVRSAQNELRDAKMRERYAQTLKELETLIEMARPEAPDETSRRLDMEKQGQARLLAAKEELKRLGAHPVLRNELPAGAYRLAAMAEGVEVDLVEIVH